MTLPRVGLFRFPKISQANFVFCIAICNTIRYNNSRKVVHTMATKTANVTARVHPEIKQQAEQVLEQLGIPVSVLIDSLYRQIIMTNSIPYSFTLPSMQTRDTMTDAQFNAMMARGLAEAKAEQGMDIDDAFEQINKSI